MNELTNRETRISVWVPVAFALTGFLIGFVTGLSMSPVVKELLPLTFGVLAGGVGFFAKLKTEHSRIAGISLSAMALMTIIGVIQGINLREGTSWTTFWTNRDASPISVGEVTTANVQQYVSLLKLRSELQRTKLTISEQARLLEVASRGTPDDLQKVIRGVEAIASQENGLGRPVFALHQEF